MKNLERMEIMLDAIKATKARAVAEQAKGDLPAYRLAMMDLISLESSLVGEAEMFVEEVKKAA